MGTPQPIDAPPATRPASAPKRDPAVRRTQGEADDFGGPPPIVVPPEEADAMEPAQEPGQNPVPLGEGEDIPALPGMGNGPPPIDPRVIPAPLLPGTRKSFTVTGGPKFEVKQYGPTENGDITFVLTGGVNVVADLARKIPVRTGGRDGADLLDGRHHGGQHRHLDAPEQEGPPVAVDPVSGVPQDPEAPLQLYMEGNVRIRKDDREMAGKGDETTMEFNQCYYDLRNERTRRP